MYKASEIKIVHLETTSKCNATCPMCLRSVSGGKVNPQLPLVDLGLRDIQKILPVSFVKQLDKLYMCGNYGDPAAASESLEIFQWLREVNPDIKLEIFSNGGLRNENWWACIAEVIDKAVFAIDGLEDTNHIYRKGVNWSKVERNVKAFLRAGGNARWDFIVFGYNEHQVHQAEDLAKAWGVQKFQVKKTGRFFSNQKTQGKDVQEVWDENGDLDYTISKPKNPKYINSSFEREKQIEDRFGSLKKYFENAPVDCKVAKEKSVYVTAEGFVLPCCWLAIRMYPWYYSPKTSEIWKMINKVNDGLDSLDAKNLGIEKVINGELFQKVLPESWEAEGFDQGKLFACSKTCGRKEFDLFKSQFS